MVAFTDHEAFPSHQLPTLCMCGNSHLISPSFRYWAYSLIYHDPHRRGRRSYFQYPSPGSEYRLGSLRHFYFHAAGYGRLSLSLRPFTGPLRFCCDFSSMIQGVDSIGLKKQLAGIEFYFFHLFIHSMHPIYSSFGKLCNSK
jgi:hypothetical protein